MKKLIIYIGHPKTRSSSLQHNVFSNLYVDGKIEYLNHLTTKNDGNGDYSVYKNYKQILEVTKFKKKKFQNF